MKSKCIFISGRTVIVSIATPEENADLVDKWGMYDADTQSIWIRAGMSAERTRCAMMHEMLHACMDFNQLGLHLEKIHEGLDELLVGILASELSQVFDLTLLLGDAA